MAASDFTKKERIFIVRHLASGYAPIEIIKLFTANFPNCAIKINKYNIKNYDPRLISGQECSQELKDLFWKLRKEYQANLEAIIPSVSTVERLQALHTSFERAIEQENDPQLIAVITKIENTIGLTGQDQNNSNNNNNNQETDISIIIKSKRTAARADETFSQAITNDKNEDRDLIKEDDQQILDNNDTDE